MQLTAAAGAGRLPRTSCIGRGSALGRWDLGPTGLAHFLPGLSFPPGTGGTYLILV